MLATGPSSPSRYRERMLRIAFQASDYDIPDMPVREEDCRSNSKD